MSPARPARRSRFLPARRRGEEGTSAVELVLYMPLLMITVLLAVQFCLVYLGKEVANAAAREASRVARVTHDAPQAKAKAYQWIDDIGRGALDHPDVQVRRVGDEVHVTVSGQAQHILPWVPFPRVSETVVGPIEAFRPDNGGAP